MTPTWKIIIKLVVFIFFVVYPWSVANMDASHPWQVGFQDPATPIMEGIIFFNGLLMTFMLFIACFVGWLLYQSLSLFNETAHADPVSFNHSTLLEVVWTIIPAGILMVISVPSYNLLYAMEEVIDPSLTIKVVGHQWYWSYECSDFEVERVVINDHSESDEVYLKLAEDHFKILKDWVDLIEFSRVETGEGEKQTQVALGHKAIKSIGKVMSGGLPKEAYGALSSRIELLALELLTNEGRKGYYGTIESYTEGEMVAVMSYLKEKLSGSELIEEQQDLVIKIVSIFKQYLRITEEEELRAASIALFHSLEEIRGGQNNSVARAIALGLSRSLDEREKAEKILIMSSMLSDCDKDNKNCEDSADVLKKFLSLTKFGLDKKVGPKGGGSDSDPDSDLGSGSSDSSSVDPGSSRGPNLNLSRAQREAYSAEAEVDRAKYELETADVELEYSKSELALALSNSKWSSIDLTAARVNQINAAYIKANAEADTTSPSLIRSRLLLKEGFRGWTNELRLKTKEISEVSKIALIKASEELKSAQTVLRRALYDFTEEESSRAVGISDSAEAEILAVEDQVLSVEEELVRAKGILKNAESELKTFSALSDRAERRLERAQLAFDSSKSVSDRTKIEFRAAGINFENATAELNGSKSVELQTDPIEFHLNKTRMSLGNTEVEHIKAKEVFYKAESHGAQARAELDKAEERLETVKGYVSKTKEILYSTPLIYEQDTDPGEPISYYDNFLWEIHNLDLYVVEAQLKSALEELSIAQIAFDASKTHNSQVVESLVESELDKSKAFANFFRATLDKNEFTVNQVESLYNVDKSPAVKEELDNAKLELLFTKAESKKADQHVTFIEFKLAEAIYDKALGKLDTSVTSGIKGDQLILGRAKEGLVGAKGNIANADLKLTMTDGSSKDCSMVYSLDSVDQTKLHSDYAELSITNIKGELDSAEIDYNKALVTFSRAEEYLSKMKRYISRVPTNLNKEDLDKIWSLLNTTSAKFNDNIEEFKSVRASLSALNIKLEPGRIGTEAYMEVLRSEAELSNAKWVSFKVVDIVSNSMPGLIEPSDVMLSDSSGSVPENTLENSGSSSVESTGSEGGSGDKDKDSTGSEDDDNKLAEEIKDMLSKIDNREISYRQSDLFIEILHTFKDLVSTLDARSTDNVRDILFKVLPAMIGEEANKNKSLKEHIEFIKDLTSVADEEVEDSESININFDSYLISEEDLIIPEVSGTGKTGKVFRLLEVDNRLLVPTNTHIRVLVTSADVLHSWAVPSLGVKVDACPGRLNQVFLFIKREGVFYGQCSELCGVNHGFMPIVVQAVSQEEYLTWVGKRLWS